MSRAELATGGDVLDREIDTLVSFPNVIETFSDEPVLLSELMSAELTGGASDIRITRIDGHDIDGSAAIALPGVRIGAGDGAGFVMRRQADGELVFIPDAGYCGITTFTYTVTDRTNEEATLLATLSVRGQIVEHSDISFANGSLSASVFEGVESAILGALTLANSDPSDNFVFKIFEGDTQVPSTRFTVIGDKLHATEPLDHFADGTIMLRVVAEDGEHQLGLTQIAVEVRSNSGSAHGHGDQFKFAATVDINATSTTSGRHLALVIDEELSDLEYADKEDELAAEQSDEAATTDPAGIANGVAEAPSGGDVGSL